MKKYFIGFISSLALTLVAFGLVYTHTGPLYVLLPLLAIAQLAVQLYFFLHVRQAGKWNTFVLAFALMIVVFIVLGTLWIMSNLQQTHEPFDGTPSPQHEH